MKTKQIIILSFTTVIITVSLIGFYLFSKPAKSYVKSSPDYFLNAQELINEYDQNEEEANQKYLNKIIQVEGTVVNKITANQGKTYVSIIDEMSGVTCTFDSIQSLTLGKIHQGNNIVVKGKCDGRLTDIRLSKCVLIIND